MRRGSEKAAIKQIDTFDPSVFESLKQAEEKHFWFKIRRKWIFDRIRSFIPSHARILEVGCGTGNVSSFLSQKGYSVVGCEFYSEAINMSWPGFMKVQGDSNSLPFKDNRFDMVGLFDVIEHFKNDVTPLKEAFRVVREGGIIALTVPARKELWSSVDEISLHKRRYTEEMLRHVFSEARLTHLLSEYMFMSLYLPMKYLRGKNEGGRIQLSINRLFNPLLKGLFNMERLISKGLSLPTGTSLIAVAQKPPILSRGI